MVRKIDELGRVVIPIETRRMLGITDGTALEFFVDDDRIILSVYAPGCKLCGNVTGDYVPVANAIICRECAQSAARQVQGDLEAAAADTSASTSPLTTRGSVAAFLRERGWDVEERADASSAVQVVARKAGRVWCIHVGVGLTAEEALGQPDLRVVRAAARRRNAVPAIAMETSEGWVFWSAFTGRAVAP